MMISTFFFTSIFILTILFSGIQAIAQDNPPDIKQIAPVRPSSGSWVGGQVPAPGLPLPRAEARPITPFLPPLLPDAPPLGTSIEGINFNEDASTTGYYHIPPDPIGAAGPNHVVSVVNTTIEWFTKAGATQNTQRLGKNSGGSIAGSFFESLTPLTGTFDPKVIYDQFEGRFLVVTLEKTTSSDTTSRILLAVSDDDDPNGSWYYHAINSKMTIDGKTNWADYPGFAVDEEAVYITANMFDFSGYSHGIRLWIVAKGAGTGGFYDGGTASVSVYDPEALAGMSGYTTSQPAHIFGSAPDPLGTFLVQAGWYSGSTDYLAVIRVDNPLSSPTFTNQWINLGDIHTSGDLPDAPQSGTTITIETNDARTLSAVWRDDYLWVTNTVNPPSGADAGQATAHWYKINTSNLSALTLTDQGNVGGEDIATGTYTFFPAIMVDSLGNMGIGFAASGSSIYPGAYFTGRLASDPAGTVQSATALRTGLDYYYRAFGGSRNRWGDYSGIALDPSDQLTFWVFNEYALTRGTILGSYPSEDGRWGTAFGSFNFNARANIKIFLEGPYQSGVMTTTLNDSGYIPLSQPFNGSPWNYSGTESVGSVPAGVVDWVLVQLRTGTDSSTTVASRAGFILSNGTIVDTDGASQVEFSGTAPGDYYLVVHHRNHLSVMSANLVTLGTNSAQYDFSADLSRFYGSQAKLLDTGVYGMYAGDANANGQVQTSDKNDYWRTQVGTAGYKSADFNLNGQVQNTDKNDYWQNNVGLGTQVP